LLLFGLINSAFYQGDILTIYAVIGFVLIPVAKLGNKTVLWIAILLMLQPLEWYNFIVALQHPGVPVGDPASWKYFGKMGEYIPGSSLLDTIYGNLTNGKAGVYRWTWEAGRVFQTASLFMLGMLAGRKRLFDSNNDTKWFWLKIILISIFVFIPLYIAKSHITEWVRPAVVHRPLETIIASWSNLAFMGILVSAFFLLYQNRYVAKVLNIFSPYGKMSMSNYIMQSIMGSFIYYGFGLAMYRYTGATYSLMIGLGLAVLQGIFSKWWMDHHRYGPLEFIWHHLTWINFGKSRS